MRATFADESWQKNFWFEHIVLAHISFSQELDWFYQLLYNLKHDEPDLEEFKAYKAIELLRKLDNTIKKRIWKSLQDTIIIVQEPREYIKNAGVEVMPDCSLRFRYKGKELTIRKTHKDYNSINKKLQKYLADSILRDSPISKIKFSLCDLPNIYPTENFFSPENILSLIDKRDNKKEVMGTIKLAARLCSAFFELLDSQTTRKIIEQLYQYEHDALFVLPKYHQEILRKAISSSRFFDKGHESSVNIIKQCFEKIEKGLNYYIDDENSFLHVEVKELDSKDDIRIQACDWASGIARNIYENKGLKGLSEKFNCIIFNGKMM